MTNQRLDHLYQLMQSAGLQAVVLNPSPSLVYLSGLQFHLMERPTTLILVPGQTPALILPELEKIKAAQASISLQLFTFGDNPAEWGQAFQSAVLALNLSGKRVGVESTHLRFLELNYLQQADRTIQVVNGDEVLSSVRLQKDHEEVAKMRKAALIAQNALRAVLPKVKPGVTEKDLAAELSIQLLQAGSDSEFPFPPIVAGGPNSANPHAVPSERSLQPGDLLLFDWGARYDGYCSDITRTFAIDRIDPEMEKIYNLVNQANTIGRETGRPGMHAGDVDQTTRSVITNGGYGEYFTHRTGHGLGMEGHEPPYMFAENGQTLEEGMVYTVEPGIYLPGKGGVRIEDDVVITMDGCLSITDYPRELTIL